jgi:hypothetical protein
MSTLAIDEESQAILEGQVSILGIVKLLFEGGTKSGQAKLGQFVEQWLGQHYASLAIVGLATDVFVAFGNNNRWFFRFDLIEIGRKDVLDTLIGANARRKSPTTSGFQAFLAVAFGQTQKAEAGTVSLLGVLT